METLGNLGTAAEKEAYDPENGSGDTDPEEEGMECESLLDNDEMENIRPSDAAAVSTAVAAACSSSYNSIAKQNTAKAGTPADTYLSPRQPREGPAAPMQALWSGDGQTYKGPPNSPSVGEKAKAYLQKIKKGERIDEIKNSMRDKLLAYEAINAANCRRLTAPYLQSGEAAGNDTPPDKDDFISIGDGRVARMFITCRLQPAAEAEHFLQL